MKRNLTIFIFSFVFASALWFYIELSLSYTINLSIPLEIQSAKSQALAEEVPSSIDIVLKGKGWDLLKILISKNLKYNLDISKLKKDSKIITEQFVNERLNLNPEVSIVEINPDTININFDKVSEKLVQVKNNIVINMKEGYSIVGKPELTPDSIKIQGASYLLNKIRSIPTEVKRFNNLNSDIEGIVNLKDTLSNLISVDTRQIKFHYKIQLLAEKNFDELEVKVLNVPEDKEVLLIPPKVNLSIRGGVDQLGQLTTGDIEANIEFGKLESDTLGFIIPEIIIPKEVNILKLEPQKLQYIIKNKL